MIYSLLSAYLDKELTIYMILPQKGILTVKEGHINSLENPNCDFYLIEKL